MKNKGFFAIWAGQLLSLLGSSLTSFAISIWIFELTGDSQAMAISIACKFFPRIYGGFFAGPLVDFFSKRKILVVCNLGVGFASLALFGLYSFSNLHIVAVYALLFVAGLFEGIQALALQTTVSSFVRKKDYSRYNGIITIVESAPAVLGPLMAAALWMPFGFKGILLIDVTSFVLATIPLLFFSIPQVHSKGSSKKLSKETLLFGFKHIRTNPVLVRLQGFFMAHNFFNGVVGGLISAYVLVNTGGDEKALSLASSVLALGLVAGGFLSSVINMNGRWIRLMLGASFISALIGRVFLGLSTEIFLVCGFLFIRNLLGPLLSNASQCIWQFEVPVEKQGRVFATRRVFGQGLYPVALLVGGALSKKTDMGTIFIAAGLLELLVVLFAFRSKVLASQDTNPAIV